MNPDKQLLTKIKKVIIDIAIFLFSFFAAFLIWSEGIPKAAHLRQLLFLFPFIVLGRILCFRLFSIYSAAWKFFSIIDALAVFRAVLPVTAAMLLGMIFLPGLWPVFRLPLGVISLEFFITLIGTLGVRMTDRLVYEHAERGSRKKNVLLIGAGDAGDSVIRELNQRKYLGIRILGFVDDDSRELDAVIRGIRVLGSPARIPEIVQKFNIDEAIITIASLSLKDVQRIINICRKTKIKLKTFQSSFEILSDNTGLLDVPVPDSDAMLKEQLQMFKDLTGRDYDGGAETRYPVHHAYEVNKPFSDPEGLSGDLLLAAGTMIKLLHLAPGASVLDLGCGCGWTSIFLARCGFQVTAVDLNAASLEIAQRNARTIAVPVRFINADMQSFIADRLFDAVVIFDSLHHCLDERSVLSRAESALRPGGKIVLCEQSYPDATSAGLLTHEAAIQAMQKYGTLEKGLGTTYLIRLLFDCGFEMANVFAMPSHYGTWVMARKPQPGKEAIRCVHYTSDFERALWFSELKEC